VNRDRLRHPHLPANHPSHPYWSPIVAALVTVVPGVLGLAMGQIWLFPSLGPTAVMQAHLPEHRASRFYNVVVAHLAGLASGVFAVWVCGLAVVPSVFQMRILSWQRVAAAGLAIAIAVTIELILDAQHPPAGSTTLLVAFGSLRPTLHDVSDVVVGVLIVAFVGEAVRRIRIPPFDQLPASETAVD